MTVLVIAEKPSVAKDLAQVLEASTALSEGAWIGNQWIVTWVIGHAAQLAHPGEINPVWKTWTLEDLPLLPREVPWRPTPSGGARIEVVRTLLATYPIEKVVCATDAGREGELIFRVFWMLVNRELPIDRLWLSSLMPEEITAALDELRPIEKYQGLAKAALGRALSDWWIGMNASRALTLTHGQPYAAGRVQTPTLAFVVDRDEEIARHHPEPITQLRVELERVDVPNSPEGDSFFAIWHGDISSGIDHVEAQLVYAQAAIEYVDISTEQIPPPLMMNLDALQQRAFVEFKLTAKQTLDIAQSLYEKHKALSYPRTGSRALTLKVAEDLSSKLARVSEIFGYEVSINALQDLSSPYVDDQRVSDHPALYPTGKYSGKLSEQEKGVLELVQRRLLAIASPAAEIGHTEIVLKIEGLDGYLKADEQWEVQAGWREIDEPSRTISRRLLPHVAQGEQFRVVSVERVVHVPSPPPRYNDATLIQGMERASLGTPATRADTIEGLIEKGYLERRDLALTATGLGRSLVSRAPSVLTEVGLTAQLEQELLMLRTQPEYSFDEFIAKVHESVESIVSAIVTTKRLRVKASAAEWSARGVRTEAFVPLPSRSLLRLDGILSLLREGIDALTEEQLLLEFNTPGANLRLWTGSYWTHTRYALLATRMFMGFSLVVRREPAFIDDEVMQLRKVGIRAERLHYELGAEAYQAAIHEIELGVDIVFLTPDVFAKSIDILAESVLIVWDNLSPLKVDLISAAHLELLAGYQEANHPSLSASAQVAEKTLVVPVGESVAFEVVKCSAALRLRSLQAILNRAEGQVLIRCLNAETCEEMGRDLGIAAYHQGLSVSERAQIQIQFQEGELVGLVATGAWPVRLEVPRLRVIVYDGLPSMLPRWSEELWASSALEDEIRVVVLVSPDEEIQLDEVLDDLMPPETALELVLNPLRSKGLTEKELRRVSGLEHEVFERYIDRLLKSQVIKRSENQEPQHLIFGDELNWSRYVMERRRLQTTIKILIDWVCHKGCRRVNLSRYYPDISTEACGICDECDADGSILRKFRRVSTVEQPILRALISLLKRGGGWTKWQLFDALRGPLIKEYSQLSQLVDGLAGVGVVHADSSERLGADTKDRRKWYLKSDIDAYEYLKFVRLDEGLNLT